MRRAAHRDLRRLVRVQTVSQTERETGLFSDLPQAQAASASPGQTNLPQTADIQSLQTAIVQESESDQLSIYSADSSNTDTVSIRRSPSSNSSTSSDATITPRRYRLARLRQLTSRAFGRRIRRSIQHQIEHPNLQFQEEEAVVETQSAVSEVRTAFTEDSGEHRSNGIGRRQESEDGRTRSWTTHSLRAAKAHYQRCKS